MRESQPLSAHAGATLVIDDDFFSRQFLARALQELGHGSVLTAESGEEALGVIERTERLDLVLCDLMMPEIDGIQTLRRIAERFPGARVIILSAAEPRVLRSARNMAQSFGLRSLGVLPKPASIDNLRSAIAALEPAPQMPGRKARPLPLQVDEIRGALSDGSVIAYFQPKVDVRTFALVGVEALVRWRHPVYGVLSPGAFLPLVEQARCLDLLTDIVLSEAVSQAANWARHGLDLTMSVNVPLVTLREADVVGRFERLVIAHGRTPQTLMLEVTEDGWLQQARWARESLTRLRLAGFGLAIDDFGTGYSTIQQLLDAPFNEIKIDQSFVRGAMADRETEIVLASSISMGHELELKVVAEGVETEAQWALLGRYGCDLIQGYYVAPPMAGEHMVEWASAWARRHDLSDSHPPLSVAI